MGGRTRAPYPSEYKAELVRLVREEGRSPSELAREFEPSAQSIMNWVAQAEIDDGKRGGLTTDEKAELRRLRSENRVLRMEKDLLEKAQYGSIAFGRRCRQAGIMLSMGSRGDCFDNSMAESFFATLECELLHKTRFRNQTDARTQIMSFIDWYNHHRRHTRLDNLSPIRYEQHHQPAAQAAQPPGVNETGSAPENSGIQASLLLVGAASRPRYVAGMAYGDGHPSPAARHIAIPSMTPAT